MYDTIEYKLHMYVQHFSQYRLWSFLVAQVYILWHAPFLASLLREVRISNCRAFTAIHVASKHLVETAEADSPIHCIFLRQCCFQTENHRKPAVGMHQVEPDPIKRYCQVTSKSRIIARSFSSKQLEPEAEPGDPSEPGDVLICCRKFKFGTYNVFPCWKIHAKNRGSKVALWLTVNWSPNHRLKTIRKDLQPEHGFVGDLGSWKEPMDT